MSTVWMSDDESEEMNLIQSKLKRRSSRVASKGSPSKDKDDSDDSSSSNSTATGTSTDSPVYNTSHRQSLIVTSKPLKEKGKSKGKTSTFLTSDDEDDMFDAKLASLYVPPHITSKISSNGILEACNGEQSHSFSNNFTTNDSSSQKSLVVTCIGTISSQRPTRGVVDVPNRKDNDIIFKDNDDEIVAPITSFKSSPETPSGGDVAGNIGFEFDSNRYHEAENNIGFRSPTKPNILIASTTTNMQDISNKELNRVLPSDELNQYVESTEHDQSFACELYQHYGTEDIKMTSNQDPSDVNVDAFGFEIVESPSLYDDGKNVKSRSYDKISPVHEYATDHNQLSLDLLPQGSKVPQSSNTNIHFEQNNAQSMNDIFGFKDESQSKISDPMLGTPYDNSCGIGEENDRTSEVDPSLYIPKPLEAIQEPIVHYFSPRNRPLHCRKTIPVSQVFPAPFSTLWKNKFDEFNQVQSEIANMLAYSDDNVVISAPTGAGKTAVFEMTIARFFVVDLQATPPGQKNVPVISKRRKIVYVAPSKALCEERYADWSKRISAMNLGIEIAVITGDGDPSDALHDLAASHFILTTPEKWDSLTRRWTEKFFLFASVKLFLVDEVHLLADESRGCCMEAIVCRMKAIQRAATQVSVSQEEVGLSSYANTSPDAINSLLRFVAVSATLPNIEDIAMFFEANEAHVFDESYRPVPLTTHVIGQGKLASDAKNGQFMFWKNLDRNIPELVIKYSNNRPTIVFCHSKADCEKLADLLATTQSIGRRDHETSRIASQTRIPKLQRVLMHGIAYHHAGLDTDDRRLVELSFSRGIIRVLCATSTIAMGVNLPAHLVIVKGTSAYRGTGEGGGYHDIDQASLLQMIGRAGRPGFDTTGTAIVMTDNDSKMKFERLVSSGLPPARSQLIGLKLVETMNTEVSQRVITSLESAINWIKGTLYYVQLLQVPESMGVKIVSNFSIDTHLFNICKNALDRLHDIGTLIITDAEVVYPLAASHIMSQRVVNFAAMKEITNIPFNASHSQILLTVTKIEGLHCPVRRSEKKILNNLHKELKLYKLEGPLSKVRVHEPWQKSFVLLQAYIEELELEGVDYGMRQEMNSIADCAIRILSAIEEFSLKGSKNGNILVQSMRLRRSITVHLWSAKDGSLRQIQGVGKSIAFSLLMNGIVTFDDVMNNSEAQLEKAANRPSPFGATLRKACGSILRSRLFVSADIERGIGENRPDILSCIIKGNNLQRDDEVGLNGSPVSYSAVVYIDCENGILFTKQNITGPETFQCTIPRKCGAIRIHLIASMIGLDDSMILEYPDQPTTNKTNCCKENSVPEKMQSKKRIRGLSKQSCLLQRDGKCRSYQPSQPVVHETIGSNFDSEIAENSSQKEAIDSLLTISVNNFDSLPLSDIHQSIPVTRNLDAFSNVEYNAPDKPYVSPSPQITPYQGKSTSTARLATNGYQAQVSTSVKEYCYDHPVRLLSAKQNVRDHHTPNIQKTSQSYEKNWNRFKYQQQQSQKRAFVRNSDNPFKSYKHDPNDSEKYLDQLASKSKSLTVSSDSIIPPEGFLALRGASPFIPSTYACQHTRINQNGMNKRRRDIDRSLLSIPDVLSQMAAESNIHAGNATQKVASQSPTIAFGNHSPTVHETMQHQQYNTYNLGVNGENYTRHFPYCDTTNNSLEDRMVELNPRNTNYNVPRQPSNYVNEPYLSGRISTSQNERTFYPHSQLNYQSGLLPPRNDSHSQFYPYKIQDKATQYRSKNSDLSDGTFF